MGRQGRRKVQKSYKIIKKNIDFCDIFYIKSTFESLYILYIYLYIIEVANRCLINNHDHVTIALISGRLSPDTSTWTESVKKYSIVVKIVNSLF